MSGLSYFNAVIICGYLTVEINKNSFLVNHLVENCYFKRINFDFIFLLVKDNKV